MKSYTEQSRKAVEIDKRFKHVMAAVLNPATNYKNGVIRCITSRTGDVRTKGFVDKSELYKIEADAFGYLKIGKRLVIKNIMKIVDQIGGRDWDFLGLEDPDIWVDNKLGLIHVYFTIPFRGKKVHRTLINLGHAVGYDLDSLEMTAPVLMADKAGVDGGAKELSVVPINKQGFRNNLVESSILEDDFRYSVVRVVISEDMGRAWKYGKVVFHPKEHRFSWIAGHASPGPLFPNTFIEVGKGKRLGLINGREANQKVDDKTKYGEFSIGLFIYDYEKGEIDWVSPKPFIRDSQAKTITFASQFIEKEKGTGILYVHIDDSFVRMYRLSAEAIKSLLP